jgi:hypothetical protein
MTAAWTTEESALVHGVVAGLVLDEGSGQVLVGIRDVQQNRRHPGVVSVPTLRVPLPLARELCAGRLPSPSCRVLELSGPWRPIGGAGSTRSLEGLVFETILAKKLVHGDSLEFGAVQGRCAAQLAMLDDVDDPTGRDGRNELTLMVTLVAYLRDARAYVRSRTASYAALDWLPPDEVIEAWRKRDAQRLFPQANPFEICIRGLCMRSAVYLLESAAVDEYESAGR